MQAERSRLERLLVQAQADAAEAAEALAGERKRRKRTAAAMVARALRRRARREAVSAVQHWHAYVRWQRTEQRLGRLPGPFRVFAARWVKR